MMNYDVIAISLYDFQCYSNKTYLQVIYHFLQILTSFDRTSLIDDSLNLARLVIVYVYVTISYHFRTGCSKAG